MRMIVAAREIHGNGPKDAPMSSSWKRSRAVAKSAIMNTNARSEKIAEISERSENIGEGYIRNPFVKRSGKRERIARNVKLSAIGYKTSR